MGNGKKNKIHTSRDSANEFAWTALDGLLDKKKLLVVGV
jgi:hypothetical protein